MRGTSGRIWKRGGANQGANQCGVSSSASESESAEGAVGATPNSQGATGTVPLPGPPAGAKAGAEKKQEMWVSTVDRGDGWRDGRGGVPQEEDHVAGAFREPSRDPMQEQHRPGCQDDPHLQDGKRIKLSPRIAKERCEMLKPEAIACDSTLRWSN